MLTSNSLPEDVKLIQDLYQIQQNHYYDSSVDREFTLRLKDIALFSELENALAEKKAEADKAVSDSTDSEAAE